MAGTGEAKTSPRRIRSIERQKQALELRLAGASFEQIGQALDYSCASSAYRAVQAVMARVPEPAVREYRLVNTWRLNRLRINNWQNAQSGDHRAIEIELKIQQEEARLLGLYAPTKTEWSGESGGPIQLQVVYDDASALHDVQGATS